MDHNLAWLIQKTEGKKSERKFSFSHRKSKCDWTDCKVTQKWEPPFFRFSPFLARYFEPSPLSDSIFGRSYCPFNKESGFLTMVINKLIIIFLLRFSPNFFEIVCWSHLYIRRIRQLQNNLNLNFLEVFLWMYRCSIQEKIPWIEDIDKH